MHKRSAVTTEQGLRDNDTGGKKRILHMVLQVLGLFVGLFILWFKQSQVFHSPSEKFREVKRSIVICLQNKTSCGN